MAPTRKFYNMEFRLPKHVVDIVEDAIDKLGEDEVNRSIAAILERGLHAAEDQLTASVVPKKPLLQRANELIGGDRQKDYGDKLQNFAQIAMLWQGTLATKLLPDAKITPEDVALLMIQVKIARLAKMPSHEDSILDVAGYAGCYEAVQNERNAGYELLGATRDFGDPNFKDDRSA